MNKFIKVLLIVGILFSSVNVFAGNRDITDLTVNGIGQTVVSIKFWTYYQWPNGSDWPKDLKATILYGKNSISESKIEIPYFNSQYDYIVIGDLTPDTTYKFKIVTEGPGDDWVSAEKTFKTLPLSATLDWKIAKIQESYNKSKNFSFTATPVNPATKPGLFSISWSGADGMACFGDNFFRYDDIEIFYPDGAVIRGGSCPFIGSSGTLQVQFIREGSKASNVTGVKQFDLSLVPTIYYAHELNSLSSPSRVDEWTKVPSFYPEVPDSYSYFRNDYIVNHNLKLKTVSGLSLPAIGPMIISVTPNNPKPGDVVTVKVNEFVRLLKQMEGVDIFGLTNKPNASLYEDSTSAPIVPFDIDPVKGTFSFRVPVVFYNYGNARPTKEYINKSARYYLKGYSIYSSLLSIPLAINLYDKPVNVTALPQTPSTVPPVISNVATKVNKNNVTLTWTTDKPTDSSVYYKEKGDSQNDTERYLAQKYDSKLVIEHSVTVSNLLMNKSYVFDIHARDQFGVHAWKGNIEAKTVPDTFAPIISSVVTKEITPGGAVVSWVTDETESRGTTVSLYTGYLNKLVYANPPITKDGTNGQKATFSNLLPNTSYSYIIKQTDAQGNVGASSVMTFKTPAADLRVLSQTTPSTVTLGQGLAVSFDVGSLANKTFYINLVDGGNEFLLNTPVSGNVTKVGINNVSVVIPNSISAPPGLYYVKVCMYVESQKLCSQSVSQVRVLSNSSDINADTVPPVITDVRSEVAGNIVVFRFKTNEDARPSVIYGKTTSYGSSLNFSLSYSKDHYVVVRDLEPDTTYHFKVGATDKAGNTAYSNDYALKTNVVSVVDRTAPRVSGVSIISGTLGSDTVGLSWNTDKKADTRIEYYIAGTTDVKTQNVNRQSLEHSVTLKNLVPAKQYYIKIFAVDASGNSNNGSANGEFTTRPPQKITGGNIVTTSIAQGGTIRLTLTSLSPLTSDQISTLYLELLGTNVPLSLEKVSASGNTTAFEVTIPSNIPAKTYDEIILNDRIGNLDWFFDGSLTVTEKTSSVTTDKESQMANLKSALELLLKQLQEKIGR